MSAGVDLEGRARELRKVFIDAMRESSAAHQRGKRAESNEHYARAMRAQDEMNALGFGLFGRMGE